MDKKDDSHPNFESKEKKQRKKSCSCQLCGRVTSVKTPPHHRASSPWAYMRTFTSSLWSLSTEDTDDLLLRTSSMFCWESIRCEPMPLFSGGMFLCYVSDNLLTLGSVVSVPPLFSQRRRGRGAFIVSVSTLRHLARLFLSLLRLTASEHKARPGNGRGEHVGWCCGVSVLSLPVNLYNLFFLYVWVRIVIYFNVYVCSCVWLFGIDLCFHLYCCRFSFFFLFFFSFCVFFNGEISL